MMNGDRPGLRTIFAEAIDRPSPGARASYLDVACAGNPELRARVEELILAHDDLGTVFLGGDGSETDSAAVDVPISERAGDVVGRYRLLEQIGEGGFGVVFMAEQEEPVRRRVALKILKPGMDTRQVVARFEAERQALAVMDHPGIARVFDAGATESGRPFFVMELVRGVPITTYCAEARLGVRQRLELFVQVCHAVQHAHQKGVIHRDLKPNNVLVTLRDGTPTVKVIDFGVAKAIHQRLTEQTLFTRFAQIIGTPLYMSPEQAALSAIDVDTRTDVYALGTLLYEVLTGVTPFAKERFAEAAYDEIRRVIREEDPPTPSQRVSTSVEGWNEVTRKQALEARELTLALRGELDWIVMKALEKDRQRRYESANAFAADIERYLADEPVLACPPSTWYRAKKFARRNRGALIVASAVAFTLIVGVGAVAGSIGWRLRERSQQAEWIAHGVKDALTDASRLRDVAWERTGNPDGWAGALQSAKAALARGESLLGGFEDAVEPELVARLRALREGLEADQRDQFAVETVEELQLWSHGAGTPADGWLVEYREMFAPYGIAPDEVSGAEAAARIAARRSPVRVALLRGALAWLGLARSCAADEREWLAMLTRELADGDFEQRLVDRVLAEDRSELSRIAADPTVMSQPLPRLWLLADVLDRDSVEGTEEFLRRAIVRHPGDFWLNHRLGLRLADEGRAEAVTYLRISATQRVRRVIVHHHLAAALMQFGETEEALVLSQAMARLIAVCPESHPSQYELAVEHAQRVVDATPDLGPAWSTLGMAHYRNGDYGRAVEALQQSLLLQDGGDCLDWFFLAMAHHRLGGEIAARKWFEKADEQMARSDCEDDELLRLRLEAAAMLGVSVQ